MYIDFLIYVCFMLFTFSIVSAMSLVAVQKFMKLLSTEKRDKILELARRNQPSSPTS